MKRCPSCQRTYPDDAPDYCSNDGMRLVSEEAVAFDPEKTVMSSGTRSKEPVPPVPPQSAAPPPQHYQEAPPSEPPPPAQSQPEDGQPPQQWSGGPQYAPQQGWSPSPSTQPQQPAPVWGSPYQQPQADAPYAAPYTPVPMGRSRALAIAALVFGVDAATIMALTIVRSRDFVYILMLALPILAIALGVTALILALRKPGRFGGVELAIAGLALGTAGLVYFLLNYNR